MNPILSIVSPMVFFLPQRGERSNPPKVPVVGLEFYLKLGMGGATRVKSLPFRPDNSSSEHARDK